jgi:hypothetical protein
MIQFEDLSRKSIDPISDITDNPSRVTAQTTTGCGPQLPSLALPNLLSHLHLSDQFPDQWKKMPRKNHISLQK